MKIGKMSKIEWTITCIPNKEIIAVCGECHTEIVCLQYEDILDQKSKMGQLKTSKMQCMKCGKVFDVTTD